MVVDGDTEDRSVKGILMMVMMMFLDNNWNIILMIFRLLLVLHWESTNLEWEPRLTKGKWVEPNSLPIKGKGGAYCLSWVGWAVWMYASSFYFYPHFFIQSYSFIFLFCCWPFSFIKWSVSLPPQCAHKLDKRVRSCVTFFSNSTKQKGE